MSLEDMSEEDFRNAMQMLADSFMAKNKEMASKFLDADSVKEAINYGKSGNLKMFHHCFLYDISQTIDGVVAHITDNNRLAFLLKHSRFVEGHFKRLIVSVEGFICSADKSRTIMRRLYKSIEDDSRIEFDYDAEYTFNLPDRIFKTHEDIHAFFEGVFHLYYGNNERYLKALKQVLKGVSENGEEDHSV